MVQVYRNLVLSRRAYSVLARLRTGGYVSGESLASELGVSRAYIHKVIDNLRSWGIPVEAEPGLGYRVPMLDDLLRVQDLLTLNRVEASTAYFERCDKSSQDIARELAHSGAASWTTVVCGEMGSGRGRLGRKWFAPRGGLWFTVILKPEFSGNLHILSLAAGVSVAEAVTALLGLEAKVKWPNDVLVDDKKVCGILVEGEAEADKVRFLLVGIGINANNEIPEELGSTATSLHRLAGRLVPRATLLAVVLARLRTYYNYLSAGETKEVITQWLKLSATIGRTVRVVTAEGREIAGEAVSVDKLGRLVVKSGGVKHHIEAGDVYHVR